MENISTYIVPPAGRCTLSTSTIFTTLVPACAGYYMMGVLVQLNGMTMYRRALLPAVLFFMVKSVLCLDLSRGSPEQAHFNGFLILFASVFAMRAITWTFTQKAYRRVSPSAIANVLEGDGQQSTISISQAIWDACDLCINFRGLGWNWSRVRQTPDDPADARSKSSFLLWTVARIVFYMLAVDTAIDSGRALNSRIIDSGTVSTTFRPSFRLHGRSLHVVVTSVIVLFLVYCMIDLVYNVMALVCVVVFGQTPAQWPPVFDAPWCSTSLGEFWGRRWHQLFRDCFISIGSRPLSGRSQNQGGPIQRALYILGAFYISGVFHDVAVRFTLCRAGDSMQTIGFFVMQGVGVIIERALAKKLHFRTGHSLFDGLIGCAWVGFWLLLWGMPMAVVWAQSGLFDVRVFPDSEPVKPLRIIQAGWKGIGILMGF